MSRWTESEQERRQRVESGETVVANIRKSGDVNLVKWAKSQGLYVFIGRGRSGIGWGNPYTLGKDGTRDEVCDAHIEYFTDKTSLHEKIHELKGKVLGCYCYPERCHGDHLAEFVNRMNNG